MKSLKQKINDLRWFIYTKGFKFFQKKMYPSDYRCEHCFRLAYLMFLKNTNDSRLNEVYAQVNEDILKISGRVKKQAQEIVEGTM